MVVAQDRASAAGTHRVLWSGLTAQGTRVPAGAYLVRVTARSEGGGEQTALCGVRLAR